MSLATWFIWIIKQKPNKILFVIIFITVYSPWKGPLFLFKNAPCQVLGWNWFCGWKGEDGKSSRKRKGLIPRTNSALTTDNQTYKYCISDPYIYVMHLDSVHLGV